MGQTGNGHPAQVLGEDDHHYNGPVRREKGISLVLCRLLNCIALSLFDNSIFFMVMDLYCLRIYSMEEM